MSRLYETIFQWKQFISTTVALFQSIPLSQVGTDISRAKCQNEPIFSPLFVRSLTLFKFIAFHLPFFIPFHSIQSIFVNFNRRFFISIHLILSYWEKNIAHFQLKLELQSKNLFNVFVIFLRSAHLLSHEIFSWCWWKNKKRSKKETHDRMLFVRDSILVLLTIHRYVMFA